MNDWSSAGSIGYASVYALAVSPDFARDRLVAALSPAGLHLSRDGGVSWSPDGVCGPFGRDLALGSGFLAVTSPAGLFVSRDSGRRWMGIAAPVEIDHLAVVDKTCLHAWSDGGGSWSVDLDRLCLHPAELPDLPPDPRLPGEALAMASAPDGSRRFIGVRGAGVKYSDDRGASWQTADLTGGAVITALHAADGRIQAELAEGVVLERSANGWREIAGETPDELIDPPPLGDGETLIGHVADLDRHVRAAAAQNAGGHCAVWLKRGGDPWRKAIAHPEPARTVLFAIADAGLYAAIGDRVYRPTVAGRLLFAGEEVVTGMEILQLAAVRDSLAVLCGGAVHVSTDRGVNWDPLAPLPGPPVTAIALRESANGIVCLAAQLGGTLHETAIAVDDP